MSCAGWPDRRVDAPRTPTRATGGLRLLVEGYGPNGNQVSLRLNYSDTRYICVDTHGSGDAYARAGNYGGYQTWRLNGR